MSEERGTTIGEVEGGEVAAELEQVKRELVMTRAALAAREERLAGLERALVEKEAEAKTATGRVGELEGKVGTLDASLSQAIASYKALVVQANPGVIAELVEGGTIAEVDGSLARARALVSRVRQGLEGEAARLRVPLGAPGRVTPDLGNLSAREKISYALGR